MRKSRFTQAQMVAILREADKGPVADAAKKLGVSEQTIYLWRKRFGAHQMLTRDKHPARALAWLERMGPKACFFAFGTDSSG